MVDAEQGFSPERIQLLEREGERAQAVEASYKTRALFSMFNNKPGLSYNPQESLYRLDGTNTWLKSVSSKGDNISIDFLPEERSASERLQLKRNKTGSYSVVYRKRVGFTFTRVALEFHKDEERGEIAITKIDIKGGASTGYIGLDRWNLLKRVSDCVGVAGQAVREVYVDNGVTQEKVIPENLPGDSLSAFQRMIEQRSSRPTKKRMDFIAKKGQGELLSREDYPEKIRVGESLVQDITDFHEDVFPSADSTEFLTSIEDTRDGPRLIRHQLYPERQTTHGFIRGQIGRVGFGGVEGRIVADIRKGTEVVGMIHNHPNDPSEPYYHGRENSEDQNTLNCVADIIPPSAGDMSATPERSSENQYGKKIGLVLAEKRIYVIGYAAETNQIIADREIVTPEDRIASFQERHNKLYDKVINLLLQMRADKATVTAYMDYLTSTVGDNMGVVIYAADWPPIGKELDLVKITQ